MKRLEDDPLVLRAFGLSRLPDVSTVSRRLSELDRESIRRVRKVNRSLVLEHLPLMGLR